MHTKKLLATLALLAALHSPVFAQEIPSVNVPDNCTVEDTSGGSHAYPPSAQFLGICALAAAREQGAINSYELTNFSFGLFLSSLNGIVPTSEQFWSISKNDVEAQVGLSELALVQNDILSFQLTDFTNNSKIGAPISFRIGSLMSSSQQAAPVAPLSGLTLHDPVDVSRATSYLRRNQNEDGSFGSPLLNDWVAIAAASAGADDIGKKLIGHEIKNPPTLSSVTDYERHAMALEALGINPYSGTGIDYISPIVESFNGIQFGDTALVNDDIFAIFPLLHAGYTESDDIIAKTIEFILFKQQANGSWAESTDLTAAAIQALSLVRPLPGTPDAIAKAVAFLHTKQDKDGGFGNTSSTSWVLQGLAAIEDSVYNWSSGTYLTPAYYLSTRQATDGGFEPENADRESRIWATAYALPAAQRQSWDSILDKFPKPEKTPALATTTVESVMIEEAIPSSQNDGIPEEAQNQAAKAETQTAHFRPFEPFEPVRQGLIGEEKTEQLEKQNRISQTAAVSAEIPSGFLRIILRAMNSFLAWLF